jgi:hypothetical protein
VKINDPMRYTNKELYELMHEQGKRRFSSECKHEQVKNGRCLNCLRKVITKQGV